MAPFDHCIILRIYIYNLKSLKFNVIMLRCMLKKSQNMSLIFFKNRAFNMKIAFKLFLYNF